MKQAVAGGLFLVVGIWLSLAVAATVEDERSLIIGVAFALGTVGVQYLLLARRVGKLEQGRGVVYYWRRQPGVLSFERVSVFSVPVSAVLW
jgi:threonine/homoserine efflux transporter RhtA